MKEISYQIFDDISGLPFDSLTDEFIRKIAYKENKTYSEVFFEMKEQLSRGNVKYFISDQTKKIKPMHKLALVSSPGKYFNKYSDAIEYLND